MSAQSVQRPSKVFRAGRVSATIWENEVERNGRQVIQPSIRVRKEYFDDRDQSWKPTDSFFASELPDLILVARAAHEHIRLRQRDGNDAPPDESAE